MEGAKSDYEIYVERYAKQRGITPEEAKKHALVKITKEYYEEESKEYEN